MGVGQNCLFSAKIYWRALFSILWPLVLLPIIATDYSEHKRCLYVVLLMAGYWITECVHMAITSMIPIVLFPIFNLVNTEDVCKSYMKDANMMFIAGLMLAIAVEYSHLHERIALVVIGCVGCSPKKLHVGIMAITAFISLWISNTAAAAIMIPIITSILKELEANGIGSMFEPQDEAAPEGQDDDSRKPTNASMCYYMSAAYAASIGGIGTVIGTGTNLTFKGIVETTFMDGPGIDFGLFMIISIPIALVILILSILVLQLWFLGLFRAKSKDAQQIAIGVEGAAIAKTVIATKRKEMGPMTFHETAVLTCFILAIILWITREPQAFPGWAELITDFKVKDGTVGMVIVLLMFCIPANPTFIHVFSKDDEKKPKQPSTGLITWRFIQKKLPWGLVFLIGSGFAIAEAAKSSKMNDYIVSLLGDMKDFPPYAVMVIGCIAAGLLTQITSNVAIANITLPVMAQISRNIQIHPLYLMYPVALACSFAYMLPVATPANAIAASACNMRTIQMIMIGFFLLVVSLLVLFATAPFLAGLVWNFSTFPDWAKKEDSATYR